mmetsp:Transcript_4406/g.7363  ORF Transcript_4406/g.7363 Transcript_4406/m.7363 type:complete len:243 (+) Transcript_4406:291-1019(+)
MHKLANHNQTTGTFSFAVAESHQFIALHKLAIDVAILQEPFQHNLLVWPLVAVPVTWIVHGVGHIPPHDAALRNQPSLLLVLHVNVLGAVASGAQRIRHVQPHALVNKRAQFMAVLEHVIVERVRVVVALLMHRNQLVVQRLLNVARVIVGHIVQNEAHHIRGVVNRAANHVAHLVEDLLPIHVRLEELRNHAIVLGFILRSVVHVSVPMFAQYIQIRIVIFVKSATKRFENIIISTQHMRK